MDALLVTKFFIPTPDYTFVPRPQLMQRLNALLNHRLTVITAPPGSGKSATTAAWLDLHPETMYGWVSLDAGDNDPARFVAYLVGALRHQNPTVQSFQMFPDVGLPPQTILTSLLNAISQSDSQIILALDDVHVIDNPAVQGLMGYLIDHAPPQLHIILLSRTGLTLPLGRLRVQHQLAEFDGHDLNFDSSEVERYFRGISSHPLSANDLVTLEKRTEGWIAGLQLAGLALQNMTNFHELLAGFTGDHAYIVDYLTDEVLNHLTPEIHEFVLRTAVLERLCADLCGAITGHNDAQTQLEALYRANLFVIPLDSQRQWFRYHHLFGELLRARLHRTQPELVPQLHNLASEWFARAGYGREAIAHAFEAGDYPRAAELIEREGQTIFGRGEIGTALGWISRLPDTVRRARPALMIGMAWPLTINGEIQEAARYIDEALETLSEQSPENHLALLGEADAIRSIHLVMRHHLSEAAVLGTQALQHLPADAYMQRAIVTMNLGMAAMFAGEVERAGRILLDAVELSRLAHDISTAAMSRHHLASIQWLHGDLAQTEIIARQMLSLAETWNQSAHPVNAAAYEWLCRIHYERNALDAAAEAIQHGIRLAEPVEIAFFLRSAWLQLACIRRAQEDTDAAQDAMYKAETLYHKFPHIAGMDFAVQRTRYYLSAGDLEQVHHWLQSTTLTADANSEALIAANFDHITLAWAWINVGRHSEALDLLNRILPVAHALHRNLIRVECHLLCAMALDALGHEQDALNAMASGITLAASEGYIRIWLDKREHAFALLFKSLRRDTKLQKSHQAYVRQILIACGAQDSELSASSETESMPEALTPREMELLKMIADGLSNQDIADSLVVSLGTVKWHLNNLYAKLEVRSRTQALVRARERGLI